MKMGATEEAGKAVGGVIDVMRSQPLVLAMMLMNVGLLLFLAWYMSRITSRTELTVQQLFTANDKLYTQWGVIVKDTSDLAEKSLHCLAVEDVLKLMVPRGTVPQSAPGVLPPLRLLKEEYPQ